MSGTGPSKRTREGSPVSQAQSATAGGTSGGSDNRLSSTVIGTLGGWAAKLGGIVGLGSRGAPPPDVDAPADQGAGGSGGGGGGTGAFPDIAMSPSIQAPDINTLYQVDQQERGRGAFSTVVTGIHKATGQPRAIKIMEKAGLVGKKAEWVTHEKEILRRTRHPAIIYLHECVMTPTQMYMIMDLMDGDLFGYLVRHKKLNEHDSALIMKQLFSAVEYLHNNSVIHRDIKPENILINSPSDIKLADFGLAKLIQEWDVKSTPCGTSFYIAPEILRGIETNGGEPLCTTREEVKYVDMWSCGVVLFSLLAGRPPFTGQVKSGHERRQLLAKIGIRQDRGRLFPDAQWAHISEDAKDLVAHLLAQDTSLRFTVSKALRHKWFAGVNAKEKAKMGEDSVGVEALKAEMNAVQNDLVEVGDAEGDTTSYNVERKGAAPATVQKKAMHAFPSANK